MSWTKQTKNKDDYTGWGEGEWGASPWGDPEGSSWINRSLVSDTWVKISDQSESWNNQTKAS